MVQVDDDAPTTTELLYVEVAYALPERQLIRRLQVERGCTALQAAWQSGITQDFNGIDLKTAAMGIFSKNLDGKTLPLPGDYLLKAGDRVEIYRSLVADPKMARLQRAAKARESRE